MENSLYESAPSLMHCVLLSLKGVIQRMLRYPGKCPVGYKFFMQQLELAVCRKPIEHQLSTAGSNFSSGFLSFMQMADLPHLKSNSISSTLSEDIENELLKCKDGWDFYDLMQKLLSYSSVAEDIIVHASRNRIDPGSNSEIFLKGNIGMPLLIASFKALLERCPKYLAGVPVGCMGDTGTWSSCEIVSDLNVSKTPFSKEAVTHPDQAKNSDAVSPSQTLPDVVACTKESVSRQILKDRIGRSTDPSLSLFDANTSSLTDSLENSSLAKTQSMNVLQPNEMSQTDDIVVKQEDSSHELPLDYTSEDAQLQLSELLITVIQGRKCGLSKPDLIDSKSNQKLPDEMKCHGRGNTFHDVAFSIEDSLFMKQPIDDAVDGDILNREANSTSNAIDAGDGTEWEWLVADTDVPQTLLPIPKIAQSSENNSTDSICSSSGSLIMHNLGESEMQLLFQEHKDVGKTSHLAGQKYKCPGCGIHAGKSAAKKFNHCEFSDEYFCPRCHDGKTSRVIPKHVFNDFNVRRYKVSKKADALLRGIHLEPIFNLLEISPALCSKRPVSSCIEMRKHASGLLKQMECCPVIWETDDPCIMALQDLPPHILRSDPYLCTMQDMIDIKNNSLRKKLTLFIDKYTAHSKICDFC